MRIEKVKRIAARIEKSRHGKYLSVSGMLDELGWPPLSQRRHEAVCNVRVH